MSVLEQVAVADDKPAAAREVHSRASRWMHWLNFPFLAVMIYSGLRIYWANDVYDLSAFGSGFAFFPDGFYDALGLRARLARGIAFHLVFGWFFALNGLAFGLYLAVSGEWRRFIPYRESFSDIRAVLLHEIGLRKEAPPQGLYNVVQQLTYSAVLGLGALALLSGFAIFKPTQLGVLTALLGGYETARAIHFIVTLAFVGFFVIHILQVLRAGPRNFMTMVTGYARINPVEADRQKARERVRVGGSGGDAAVASSSETSDITDEVTP